MDDNQKLKIEKLRSFFKNFLSFLVTLIILYPLNTFFFPNIPLLLIITIVWGLIIFAHAMYAFSFFGFFGEKFEQEMIANDRQPNPNFYKIKANELVTYLKSLIKSRGKVETGNKKRQP